jgi:hypothetical protein
MLTSLRGSSSSAHPVNVVGGGGGEVKVDDGAHADEVHTTPNEVRGDQHPGGARPTYVVFGERWDKGLGWLPAFHRRGDATCRPRVFIL